MCFLPILVITCAVSEIIAQIGPFWPRKWHCEFGLKLPGCSKPLTFDPF